MIACVDLGKCVGQGMCVLYAPNVFALSDEDGRAQLRTGSVPQEQEDAVRQAARACPEQAISITE
jgi:ferredoxin|tara:strand:+ start:958 stop:1152 length:195 start_codon:yes stop_codon:yes gene_type:complete